MVWTPWHHFPDCKAILLFPSYETSSARLERLTVLSLHARSIVFLVGMACTHFLSCCLWFLCHIVKTKQMHMDMFDRSNKYTCPALQILRRTHCTCMLQLQPEKIENGIQLIWFASLPLISLNTLSITNKVIQVKELLSHFLATWKGPSSILSQHNSPEFLPKRSMRTKSLPFRITLNYWTRTLFRVIFQSP